MKFFLDETINKVSFVKTGEEYKSLLFTFVASYLGSVIRLLNKTFWLRDKENFEPRFKPEEGGKMFFLLSLALRLLLQV